MMIHPKAAALVLLGVQAPNILDSNRSVRCFRPFECVQSERVSRPRCQIQGTETGKGNQRKSWKSPDNNALNYAMLSMDNGLVMDVYPHGLVAQSQ